MYNDVKHDFGTNNTHNQTMDKIILYFVFKLLAEVLFLILLLWSSYLGQHVNEAHLSIERPNIQAQD